MSAVNDKNTVVADAMRDLEDDIYSLCNMAQILGELLNGDLVSYRDGRRISMPKPGGSMSVDLTYRQLEVLSFAWNDVICRSERLKKKFNAAIEGKAVQS